MKCVREQGQLITNLLGFEQYISIKIRTNSEKRMILHEWNQWIHYFHTISIVIAAGSNYNPLQKMLYNKNVQLADFCLYCYDNFKLNIKLFTIFYEFFKSFFFKEKAILNWNKNDIFSRHRKLIFIILGCKRRYKKRGECSLFFNYLLVIHLIVSILCMSESHSQMFFFSLFSIFLQGTLNER